MPTESTAGTEAVVQPGPVRVEVLDLEQPLPPLDPDAQYQSAWLVARHGGKPRGIVEVDLVNPDGAVEHWRRLADRESAQPPAPEVPDGDLPTITVVIPSIVARVEELDRCLGALADLDYPEFELLVVDNRRAIPADDPLPGLLADRPRVRAVRAAQPGVSAARNAGVAAATGDIVVFTDDDVHVDPRWLRAIGGRFARQPALEAVTGLILPAELETPAQIYFERYYGGFSGERTFAPLTLSAGRSGLSRARVTVCDDQGKPLRRFAVYGVGAYGAGANMAFRRSTLTRLGGFDVSLGTGTPSRGGEDLATLIEVLWSGGQVGYEPGAVVYHKHREEYSELLHQLHGNGVGFTAMLASLVGRDPRHLLGVAAQLPLAGCRLIGQTAARLRGRAVTRTSDATSRASRYPAELARQELRGLLSGAGAYLSSRSRTRKWSSAMVSGVNEAEGARS